MKACITYDIVTPESAEDGDTAENGWYLPGGWTFNLASDEREAVLAEARAGEYDLPLREAVKEALSLGTYEGQLDTWGNGKAQISVRTVDGEIDYQDGSETNYTLNVDELSVGSARRLKRYLESNGVRFY